MHIQVRFSRSIRYLVAVASGVALLTALAASSALAAEAKTFTGSKDCTASGPSYPNTTGSCLISVSNVKILLGATVHYTDVAWYSDHLTSPVSLTAIDKHGSTATGRCTFYFAGPASGTGHCEYWEGTGKLEGFHATMKVVGTIPDSGVYSLSGTYWFDRHHHDNDE
jgi:hypothetical protein